MAPLPRTWLIAGLALVHAACAGPERNVRGSSSPEQRPASLATLGGEACTAESVVALCSAEGCRLYWCSAVAPALSSGQRLRNPDGSWGRLPGAITLSPDAGTRPLASDTLSPHGVGGAGLPPSAQINREQTLVGAGDVIQQILILEKPGAVAQWWESGPTVEPGRFSHPLSDWERRYIEKMSGPGVPEAIRMWPPVTPEHLTLEQRKDAERLFGHQPTTLSSFSNWENRRRIVHHYLMTHPATIRLLLSLYGFTRDINPLFFSLERGWQMVRGKEMFTGQDVSRLGAAAEFFSALALSMAGDKVMRTAREPSPHGLQPPSEPGVSLQKQAGPPEAMGKVIPLDSARAARTPAPPGTQEVPMQAEPPLAATGTDGSAPRRQAAPGKGPVLARRGSPDDSGGLSSTRVPPNRGGLPPGDTGPEAGGFGSLVDAEAGDTLEVLEAKCALEEATAPGPRLPRNMEAVRKASPSLERPPAGVAPDSARWREYVKYYATRLDEMEAAERAGRLASVEPPLDWPSYQTLRDTFARGIRYQRVQVAALREVAKRMGFSKPHIQANAGVLKGDLRYADALVIETDPSKPFRVEAFSFKSKSFRTMKIGEVTKEFMTDALNAKKYYGGEIDIRTPALGLRGRPVKVDKVHLIYDSDEKLVDPKMRGALDQLMKSVFEKTGVEVRFQ